MVESTDYLYIGDEKNKSSVFLRHYFCVQTQENICAAVNKMQGWNVKTS